MSKRLGYLPKLDSLRAIAALMVMCTHFLIEGLGFNFGYGGNGVHIFFVISGFLITGILLAQKDSLLIPARKIYFNFIIKRALRLFPVYYLFLIAIVVASWYSGVWIAEKKDLWHYFTYTQNYLFFTEGFKGPALNHTWSLAVEEQFYIVWPLLILFIPKRFELGTIIALIGTGILSRIYFINFCDTPGTVLGVTPIHFDTLGAGALLAWLTTRQETGALTFIAGKADLAFLLTFVLSATLTYFGYHDSILLPTSITLMGFSLVACCTVAPSSRLDFLFRVPGLAAIGKMSYGLYLFHKPIRLAIDMLLLKTGHNGQLHPIVLFLTYTVVTLAVTTASWYILEKNVLKLKERFDL